MKPVQILLLDDSEDDLCLARDFLDRDKISNDIFYCNDAKKAERILKSKDIDVLFVDLHMGEEDGLEFIDRMRSLRLVTDQSIIVISGCKDPKSHARADLLGVSVWIDKPLNLNKLHHMVKNVPELYLSIVRRGAAL